MTVITLYLITLVVFVVIDAIVLSLFMRPFFERYIADWLLDTPRIVPAVLFYLGYTAGVLWFVSVPALSAGGPMQAVSNGFIMGLIAYGTYELSNFATLTKWSPGMAVVDTLWGGIVTGMMAGIGVWAARFI